MLTNGNDVVIGQDAPDLCMDNMPMNPKKGEPILHASHITKRFSASEGRTLLANHDVSLTARCGESLGIVGESGCGKSTFVKMLVHMYPPSEGKIFFKGKDITNLKGADLRENHRRIQMVFQDPSTAFSPKMKVVDILTEAPINFGLIKKSEKRAKAAELLKLVELPEEFMDRYPHSMSGGQRQRIGIARALAVDPDIIIFDEATSALDVAVQQKIVQLLCRIQKEKNFTYIFIAHDIALVEAIANDVVVMYLGNVVEVLPGADVGLNKTLHPYTQALIGAIFSTRMDFTHKIQSIDTEAPSPLDVPPGCPFQDRCLIKEDICCVERPELVAVAPRHKVACHKYAKGVKQ